ncbi:DsbA family protein [Cupriavidus necator]
MQRSGANQSRTLLAVLLVAASLIGVGAWLVLRPQAMAPATVQFESHAEAKTGARSTAVPGPPWRRGRSDARFTVIEYADLECPFCRTYFPVLKRWIDEHPDVALQWHHLPLAMHEPAASAEARLVECVGAAGGDAAFWQAVEWVYTHTRGNGQGLPEELRYPDLSPAAQQCLASERPNAFIRAQAEEAAKSGVTATPALFLLDRETGRTLLLHGPVEGDALLSALDLLAAGGHTAADPYSSTDMPAAIVGDMPR